MGLRKTNMILGISHFRKPNQHLLLPSGALLLPVCVSSCRRRPFVSKNGLNKERSQQLFQDHHRLLPCRPVLSMLHHAASLTSTPKLQTISIPIVEAQTISQLQTISQAPNDLSVAESLSSQFQYP